jgi:hypothetical protein
MPVAVEKLACEKSAKIRTRQEALQTILFDHLDIFYPTILSCFRKKGVFQQPRLLPTVIETATNRDKYRSGITCLLKWEVLEIVLAPFAPRNL